MVEVLKMFTDALHLFLLYLYELSRLLLTLHFLGVLCTVPPQLVHLHPRQPLVLAPLQLLNQLFVLFGYLLGLGLDKIELRQFFVNELIDVLFEFIEDLPVGSHGLGEVFDGFAFFEDSASELFV